VTNTNHYRANLTGPDVDAKVFSIPVAFILHKRYL